MTQIIRLNTGKKIKLFPELFTNKFFGDTFVSFVSNRSLIDNFQDCLAYQTTFAYSGNKS